MDWGDNIMSGLSGKTRVVGIIGNPISHSLSPRMQNAAFAAAGLDYVYIPFEVKSENLEQAIAGLKVLGVSGFNVTIPHKTAIIPFLDKLDESAEAAGAVNTVQILGNELIGHNTDGDGLVDSLAVDLAFSPDEAQILLVGAGGAARGAIAALCRSGAKKIVICNRSMENVLAIKRDMNIRYPATTIDVVVENQLVKENLFSTSLVVNTTSLGMNGEHIQCVDVAQLPGYAKVYDMVYALGGTPLVHAAESLHLKAANGLGMLVAQGERAFEIWTGQKPPKGVMRRALYQL